MRSLTLYCERGSALLAVLSILLAATANVLAQGSLDPPPGPPQPLMKTLNQVEPRIPITNIPYTISLSGSYYLMTNMVATSSGNGIRRILTFSVSSFSSGGCTPCLNVRLNGMPALS